MQGAARCFERPDLVWVQRGIRSLSASSVLLLLSVVNANQHVFFLPLSPVLIRAATVSSGSET